MGHGHHDSDRPPAGHQHGCDHDCSTCGASPVGGLAACPYCRAGYPGTEPGATCPGCNSLSLKGRTVCAHCQGSLTRCCIFCTAASLIELAQCPRCHEAFEGAEERKRARAQQGVPHHRADPTGANIFNTLDSILKR